MKKLIIISITLLVLTFIALVGYGVFEGTIDYHWNTIAVFMLIIIAVAALVGLIFYFAKKKFTKSFFITLASLSSTMLCITVYHGTKLWVLLIIDFFILIFYKESKSVKTPREISPK